MVGRQPFDEDVLHGIFGIGPRTEDAVGQAEQMPAPFFKHGGRVDVCHDEP